MPDKPFRRRSPFKQRRSTPVGEHLPVLLPQVLHCLNPQPGEIVLDCTLGFAGHACALLDKVGPSGRLIGLDMDQDNLIRAALLLEKHGGSYRLHHGNFAGVASVLAVEELTAVDLVIADLGMSSMQLDDPERGFSYVREGPLDMRMDRSRGRTAAELINEIDEMELALALKELGDEPAASVIARAIVDARTMLPIRTTKQLAEIVGQSVNQPTQRGQGWRLRPKPNQWQTHPAARTFQVIRILVNRELANLQQLLRVLPSILKPGGRAAIISFHSGEDRLVKQAFKTGLTEGSYDQIAADPLRATFAEKQANPRSRSAKLRWVRRALSA